MTPRFRVAAMVADPVIAEPDDERHDGEEAWLGSRANWRRASVTELVLNAGEAVHIPAGTPRTIHDTGGARYVRASPRTLNHFVCVWLMATAIHQERQGQISWVGGRRAACAECDKQRHDAEHERRGGEHER